MAIFVKYDLGHCAAGSLVEVTPAQTSNVWLMDAHNFELYRRGRRGRAIGGTVAVDTTVQLQVQTDDRWMVVVDLGGGRGRIRASIKKLDAPAIDSDVAETLPRAVSAERLLSGR
jgi:Domain of unknown function (DUF1883)